jgi:hypothetical protein
MVVIIKVIAMSTPEQNPTTWPEKKYITGRDRLNPAASVRDYLEAKNLMQTLLTCRLWVIKRGIPVSSGYSAMP